MESPPRPLRDRPPGRIRSSLRSSFLDGLCWAVMTGLGDTFLAPYALALGASPGEIGLLTSLPGLMASLSQYAAAPLTRRLGAKRAVRAMVLLHALLWLPTIALPWLGLSRPVRLLLPLVTLYGVAASLANPAWYAIMTRYVPAGSRGAYFSFRSRWTMAVTLATSFLAGGVLAGTTGLGARAFALIFVPAFLFRLGSWWFIGRMHEPRIPRERAQEAGAAVAAGAVRTSIWTGPFRRFTLFAAVYSFGAYLAAPFFPVLMLKEWGWGYLPFTVMNTALSLGTLLAVGRWGRHADRAGNVAVLRVTGLLAGVIPLLWIVPGGRPWLVGVNLLAGFAWAGYNLSAANAVFDLAPPESRVRHFAAYTLVNGLGIFLGSLAGGLLIPVLPPVLGSRVLAVCVISAAVRLAAWAFLLPFVPESRPVAPVSGPRLLLAVAGLRPLPPRG